MSVEQFPFALQDETFSAAITRRALGFLLARGATVGSVAGGIVGSADCAVTAPASGMSVNVAVGEMIVPGSDSTTQSGYYLYVSSTTNVAIATADPTNHRIDLVCGHVGDAAYGGTDGGSIVVTTGTPAGSPVAPATPGDSSLLADVNVPNGATSIITADITDERKDVTSGLAAWNVVLDTSGGAISTALSGDSRVCDATTSSTTYSSLSGGLGARYKFARKDATANTCTIDAPAGGSIVGPGCGAAGVASIVLNTEGAFIELQGDGTNLRIVGGAPTNLNTVESYISTAVPLTANTATNVTSVSLRAGTWLIQARAVITQGSATADVDAWIGPTSASTTGSYAADTAVIDYNASGNTAKIAITKVITLSATTTVYLGAESSSSGGHVEAVSLLNSLGNVSGITATLLS